MRRSVRMRIRLSRSLSLSFSLSLSLSVSLNTVERSVLTCSHTDVRAQSYNNMYIQIFLHTHTHTYAYRYTHTSTGLSIDVSEEGTIASVGLNVAVAALGSRGDHYTTSMSRDHYMRDAARIS